MPPRHCQEVAMAEPEMEPEQEPSEPDQDIRDIDKAPGQRAALQEENTEDM